MVFPLFDFISFSHVYPFFCLFVVKRMMSYFINGFCQDFFIIRGITNAWCSMNIYSKDHGAKQSFECDANLNGLTSNSTRPSNSSSIGGTEEHFQSPQSHNNLEDHGVFRDSTQAPLEQASAEDKAFLSCNKCTIDNIYSLRSGADCTCVVCGAAMPDEAAKPDCVVPSTPQDPDSKAVAPKNLHLYEFELEFSAPGKLGISFSTHGSVMTVVNSQPGLQTRGSLCRVTPRLLRAGPLAGRLVHGGDVDVRTSPRIFLF